MIQFDNDIDDIMAVMIPVITLYYYLYWLHDVTYIDDWDVCWRRNVLVTVEALRSPTFISVGH